MNDYSISHDVDGNRFEAEVDGESAVLLYKQLPDTIIFISTRVPPAIEGRGVGSALARTGLEYAREHALIVVPQCPFVRAYIEQHPEYKPLLG
jgi:predicted GNAT family acetyltransferase